MWSMFTLARVAQYGYENPTGSSLLVTLLVGGVFATSSDVLGTMGCAMLATLVATVHEWKTRRSWLALASITPLLVVWANTHTSFFVGILYVLLACLGCLCEGTASTGSWRSRRYSGPLFMVAALAIIGCFLNPQGLAIWQGVSRELVAIESIARFAPQLSSPPSPHVTILVVVAVFTCGAIGFSRRKLRVEELLVFGVFASLSALSRNYAPFAIIASVPILARHFAETRMAEGLAPMIGDHIARHRQLAAIACLVPAAMFAASISNVLGSKTLVDTYSVAALSFISKSGLTRRVLHDPRIGGFMSYYTPRIQTFADSRLGLHELRWWREYTDVLLGRTDPDGFFKRWDPLVVVLPNDLPLRQIVQLRPDFAMVYRDAATTVMVKRGAGYDNLIVSQSLSAVRIDERGR
jgi:hypothetical protein